MKHTIKNTLALIMMICATVVVAADSAKSTTWCRLVTVDDMLYRVVYQSEKEENVNIQIFDKNQQSVYNEKALTTSFIKNYDLSFLPYGTYTLEVTATDYQYKEEIVLGDVSSFQMKLEEKGERKVSLVGTKKAGKDMNLYILDDSQEVIYKENFDKDSQVHKNYNFQDMRSQKVTFLLYHNDILISEEDFVF